MNKLLLTAALLFSFLAGAFSFISTISTADAAVHVNGYFRKNGTYVQPYYRSNPDDKPYNNYSYPGNTNPYTGETAGGNPDTYLNNYSNNSSSYSSSGSNAPTSSSDSTYRAVIGGYYVGAYLVCTIGYYKLSDVHR